jgi:FKBP-type peptidyl-prolyl cis-trans isomerase 2
MNAKENHVISFHYTGTLSDGKEFDSSKGREPLQVILGLGMIIPGLEKELFGMKKGDKKKVVIPANLAYGERIKEAVQEVPKSHMPKEIELKEGLQLVAQGPHGPIPVQIAKVNADTVTVDFNHPLAGKELTFHVEVTEVREQSEEEKKALAEQMKGGCCGGGDCHSHGEEEDCCSKGSCGSGSCGSGKCEDKKEKKSTKKDSSKK